MRQKGFFLVSILLIAFLARSPFVRGQETSSSPTELAYSRQSATQGALTPLKAPGGKVYRLSLIPQMDINRHVVVLELSLKRPGTKKDDSNLLDAAGKLHGYQPYFFAASDFAQGAQKSTYGDTRVIELPHLGMKVRIRVASVNVGPVVSNAPGAPTYQFDGLTLQIVSERLTGENSNSKNSTQ